MKNYGMLENFAINSEKLKHDYSMKLNIAKTHEEALKNESL